MFKFIDTHTIERNIPLGNLFVYHGGYNISLHLTYDSVYKKFFFDEVYDIMFDSQQDAIVFAKDTIGIPKLYIEFCAGCKQHPERFVKLEKDDFEQIS